MSSTVAEKPTPDAKRETNPARRPITVTLSAEDWGRVLVVYKNAVARHCYPATWRPSEAAMTKASAATAVAALQTQLDAAGVPGLDAAAPVAVTLTYKLWDALQGDVAHFHQSKYASPNDRVVLLATYRLIRARLGGDPDDRQFIEEVEAEAAEVAEAARLEKELERTRRKLERRRQARVAARTSAYDRAVAAADAEDGDGAPPLNCTVLTEPTGAG